MLTVRPMLPSTAIANRNDTGTASPTSSEERKPSIATVMIIVSATAVSTLLPRSSSMTDRIGLVLQVADLDGGRPARPFGLDQRSYLLDGLDDVAADPLLDLERQRRAALDPSEAFRILEGAADLRHIAQGHDPVRGHLDRHAQHIGEAFDQPRHLDREAALADVQEPAATSWLLRWTRPRIVSSCRS